MGFSPVNIVIGATATEAIVKFREVNAELDKMEQKSLKAGGSISNLDRTSRLASAAVMGLGVAAAGMAFEGVKAALASEAAFARMNTAITNAGQGSVANLAAAKALAEGNTKLGYTTVQTATAYGTLITATGNSRDSQKLLTLAMDLARYKHEDLATAADVLARGTQGSAKAFKELGITLDSSLPKQEAINKAFDQMSQKISGQNAAYLDTFAGKISVLKAQFQLFEERIGGFLIPILTKLMDFITRFGPQLLIFAGVVGGVALAIKGWELATTAYLAVNAYMSIALAKQIAGEGLLAAQTAGLSANLFVLSAADAAVAAGATAAVGPMAALSAVMDANPIGLMVIAVGALVLALYGFKKIWDSIMSGGNNSLTNGSVNSGRVPTLPGYRYDPKTNRMVKDGFVSPEIANMNDQGSTSSKTGFDLSGYTGKVSLTPAQKAAAAAAKAAERLAVRAEKAATSANTKTLAEVSKLNSELVKVNQKYLDDLNVAQDAFNVSKTNAQIAKSGAEGAAQKTFNDYMKVENERYAKEKAKLFQANADQIDKINQASNAQLASIVKQSVDLLRNAFSGATKFDIGTMFTNNTNTVGSTLINQIKNGVQTVVSWWGKGSGRGIDGVLSDLQTQLAAANQLAQDAAALAGQGYSQTFIQQIVSQGTDLGDKMAKTILNSTPQQRSRLQDLYGQLQKVSDNGVNALSESMSKPGKLATQALNQAYTQAQSDLVRSLAAQKDAYDDATATSLAAYNTNIGNAETTRDTALSSAADAYRTAMNAANQALSSATSAAQKIVTDSLAVIAKEFNDKLGSVKSNIASTVAAIASLKAAIAGSQTLASQSPNAFLTQQRDPSGIGVPGLINAVTPSEKAAAMRGGVVVNQNINVSGSTAPADIARATTDAIKYGGIAVRGPRLNGGYQ